jgi:hypothetical protein
MLHWYYVIGALLVAPADTRVSYNGITAGFQPADRGSTPLTRSSNKGEAICDHGLFLMRANSFSFVYFARGEEGESNEFEFYAVSR